MQGQLKKDKETTFIHVQKAYDIIWCDGVWYKLWNMDINRKKIWWVINPHLASTVRVTVVVSCMCVFMCGGVFVCVTIHV